MSCLGLEHPPAGAYVTVCPTEPLGLYILGEINVFYTSYRSYIQIHTHRYRYIQYIHIHTHTYTWQSASGGGFEQLLRPLATPLRSPTYPDHLGRGSGRARRARNACGMHIGGAGGALWTPPTRAARAGAQKRVRVYVPDGGKKWSAT